MTKFKSLLAASLAAVSLNAFAADWNMVSSSAEEQVFVDSQSIIKGTDNTIQVRILENFAHTNDMGQGVYEHKSRLMLMAVDCEVGAVGFQHWSLYADALGSGATVWADSMQNGPAFFRPEYAGASGYGRVMATVCNSPVAMQN